MSAEKLQREVDTNGRKEMAPYLLANYHYDRESGVVYNKAGRPVGFRNARGYLVSSILRRNIQIHRLAWLLAHGSWPERFIDHINGDKADNRLANLRLATHAQNIWNRPPSPGSRTGIRGVYPRCGRFVTDIKVNGKTKHLGTFDTKEEAAAVYLAMAEKISGEYLHESVRAAALRPNAGEGEAA